MENGLPSGKPLYDWWCPEPDLNRYAQGRGILSPLCLPISPSGLEPGLQAEEYWRRDPESNRGTRLCRPMYIVVNQSLTKRIHPLSARPKKSNILVCRKSYITADMIADTGVATLPLLTYRRQTLPRNVGACFWRPPSGSARRSKMRSIAVQGLCELQLDLAGAPTHGTNDDFDVVAQLRHQFQQLGFADTAELPSGNARHL